MRPLTTVLALLAASLSGSAALAAGPVEEPPTEPVIVEAERGHDWTGPSLGLQFGLGDVTTTGPVLSGDGGLVGIRAYYDLDLGTYVLGGGLQYDVGDIGLGGVTDVTSVFRLGARAGFDLDRNWVYGTAGYARVDTSEAATGSSGGYFIGAGYEVFVTDRVTVGAEVLYHEFDDFDLGGLEAEATTANVSVNFRF